MRTNTLLKKQVRLKGIMGAIAILLFATFQLTAQSKTRQYNPRITSQQFLEELMSNPSATNEYVITSQHTSSLSGVEHTYIRQAINGIEVYGTESSMHKASNGATIRAHVNFVASIENTIVNSAASISPEEAIQAVANQMGYTVFNLQQKGNLRGINQKGVFNGGGISNRDIPVKLMYYYKQTEGTRLVWELSVNEKNTADWWNFRVDAATGKIIDKDNWTVSCNITGDHSEEGHNAMATNLELKTSKITDKITIADVGKKISEGAVLVPTYKVFPMPFESPYDTPRVPIPAPSHPVASPDGWHTVGTTTYAYTKGNNISAFDDGEDDDVGTEADHTPESAPGLIFDYAFEATAAGLPVYFATDQSEDAAITNLFYWNNIIHDITYLYGFDEVAGNFQSTNFGLGGEEGDSVDAQAQDSADLAPTSGNRCNANFATPPDGDIPIMQMYICDGPMSPGLQDGSYDALVVTHEYAHGISTRLVGGACFIHPFANAEQMGEGWSDFFGYMLTMNDDNFGSDRPVGNFLKDLGPVGPGIRPAPYSTDGSVNGFTYGDVADAGSISVPHGIGFIWATMLYDLTQILIDAYGFDPDLHSGTGGNNIALKLVMEGMKFTPVVPGFVNARDGILDADFALTGGENECFIWLAFSGRGLGVDADQGSTFDRFDGIPGFDMPVASFTPSRLELCVSEGIVTGLGGGRLVGGSYSGSFVTNAGDGKTFEFDTATAGVGTHSITYFDACTGTSAMATIEVIPDTLPIVICKDATVTLDAMGEATIENDDVIANIIKGNGSLGYEVDDEGVFAPTVIAGTVVTLAEDSGTGPLPIGFDFSFFGISYDEFYIASNGFVSLTGTGLSGIPSYSSTVIPKGSLPNGMIALAWTALSPHVSGVVQYKTVGTEPFRKLVVSYEDVPFYLSAKKVTVQVHLYEGTNIIEIHNTLIESVDFPKTQGIENKLGDKGYASPGRNYTEWTADEDMVIFKPISPGMPDNCGSPVIVTLSKSDFTCDDIGVNVVTVTVDDGMGGIDTCTAEVTVEGTSTTWTGSWSDSAPTLGSKAVFSSSYSTSTADIDACSCEINSGATITVEAGDYLNVKRNISVEAGSSLVVEHTGNVTQVDEDVLVTNAGTINVKLTTPDLTARDFMIMGSPMSTEDETVFTDVLPAYQVLNHTTADFDPYVGTPPVIGVNFHDMDSNDWSNFTGTLSPAEGYLVRPSYTSSGTYDYLYEAGTLNTGVISYDAYFGDDKEDSPNVLANPYASAMDATMFIDQNPIVDEVYFWEHLTTPISGIPGPLTENFSMEDISTYNGTMGIPASNDTGTSTTPNGIISTGQGFGIKANAAGDVSFTNAMRLTSGNTTLRRPVAKDLIWLTVREGEYHMGSTTGIGFLESASENLDPGFDTQKLGTVVSLYSHLPDGSEQLGIQGREIFDSEITIPMGFSTLIEADGGMPYVISISELDGSNIEEATVYLIDHLENTITNLSDGNYEFLSDAGTFDNRFILQFESIVLETESHVLDEIAIYPNPASEVLQISSPIVPIEKVELRDLMGRIIYSESFRNENNVKLNISTEATGVYFVSVITSEGTIVKRLIKK
ncbi:M36 family metallopeptidase [Ulvibacter antarcticus]|uniref:Putative secreted protein (Por secretion system target) n=1 Tax=Ulvibacter antarcticus TaxID=442714 RepID=A0A3L9YE78_9FLAO|nr:M36 family metallopeptidase [Ulvibacter antarcticus]RMA57757.1 putative secreted protein (Por secretion system target) [Ulvibacter antarcticus]